MKKKKDRICKNCDCTIIDPKQKDYCCTNCRIEYNEKTGAEKRIVNRIKRNKKDEEEGWYDCICPGCGNLHQVKMYWTGGSVTPRVRCKGCKGLAVYRESHGVIEHTTL